MGIDAAIQVVLSCYSCIQNLFILPRQRSKRIRCDGKDIHMEPALISPASATLAGIPAKILFILIPLAGIGVFAWIMRRRIEPLLKAAPDDRFQRIPERIRAVLKIWLGQWRHPRYMLAGVLHIVRLLRLSHPRRPFDPDGGSRVRGRVHAAGFRRHLRRGLQRRQRLRRRQRCSSPSPSSPSGARAFKPARYAVPEKYGKDHTPEALFVLGLIATLLITESLFEASLMAAQRCKDSMRSSPPPLTLVWLLRAPAGGRLDRHPPGPSPGGLHDPRPDLFLLSVLPADGQTLPRHHLAVQRVFHAARPGQREARAPRRRREPAGRAQILRRQEVRGLHLEAHAGLLQLRRLRPLFGPLPGQPRQDGPSPRGSSRSRRATTPSRTTRCSGRRPPRPQPLIGGIYSEDEIWSCTTCGACEEECPVGDRIHRQDGGSAPGHGGRGPGAPVAAEAVERP